MRKTESSGPKGVRPFMAFTLPSGKAGVFYYPDIHELQHPHRKGKLPNSGRGVQFIDAMPVYGEAIKACVILNKTLTKVERRYHTNHGNNITRRSAAPQGGRKGRPGARRVDV